jgi:hypothetical protein
VIQQFAYRLHDAPIAGFAAAGRFADHRIAVGAMKCNARATCGLPQPVHLASKNPWRIVFANLRPGLDITLAYQFQEHCPTDRAKLFAVGISIEPFGHGNLQVLPQHPTWKMGLAEMDEKCREKIPSSGYNKSRNPFQFFGERFVVADRFLLGKMEAAVELAC